MTESWILRNLTYLFSRQCKRGHRPRDEEFIKLMAAAGIPVPEGTPTRSLSGSSPFGEIYRCRTIYFAKQKVQYL